MLRKEVGEGGVPIFPERFDGKIAWLEFGMADGERKREMLDKRGGDGSTSVGQIDTLAEPIDSS